MLKIKICKLLYCSPYLIFPPFIKTKDKKLKAIGYSGALSAYLGITEPAIFGINLRFKKPLIAGCIGGAIGVWFVALVGVKANAYGVTGIFGILITMFEVKNLLLYLAGIAIASGAAFSIPMAAVFSGKKTQPPQRKLMQRIRQSAFFSTFFIKEYKTGNICHFCYLLLKIEK